MCGGGHGFPPRIACGQDRSWHRTMGLSGFFAELAPEVVDVLVALAREIKNVRAIGLRDFQLQRREDQCALGMR